MAQLTTNQTAFFNLPLSIQRLNPRPLDSTSVWNSYEDACAYAKDGATAYVGQILSVVETIDSISLAHLYVIQNTDGVLRKLDMLDTAQGDSIIIDNNVTINGWAKIKGGVYFSNSNSSVFANINDNGTLVINGPIATTGFLTATNGFALGQNGKSLLTIAADDNDQEYVHCALDFNIAKSHGLRLDSDYVINFKNNEIIAFAAPNRIMNLGDYGTVNISLQADIYNDNNDIKLVTRFGDGYFPNSFQASYGKSNVLIKTYQNDNSEGVLIPYNLSFGTEDGPLISTTEGKLFFRGQFYYNDYSSDTGILKNEPKKTTLSYKKSDSYYASLSALSSTLMIETEADFYEFDKPVEGKKSLGIANSKTRISDGQLFFDNGVYLVALSDGIKHYGNNYFAGSTGSVEFSSGFAGKGWQIAENQTTGNAVGTFDELVIRKKMRVYELEVQELSTTNGALWVSDNCSGDAVTLIE